ncbi:hypothetical protein [Pseudomonas sp. 5P_3.1_Bac2]|uniref:hypothetical protein n=1 Tax=Pseudomonas sp. 5P_3.1_Bac2 TaxID=2971617 RepID=UPI0021C5838B|nr:hypothetical protein [Pseudomonas sp. 5P_3.1_Bac2]MCU1717951.1 hypothetical protein [Pseudomonas sp. 5P_3.1_Bac2]
MNVARRSLLKGAAVGGLSAAALSASGLGMASSLLREPARPALALVSGSAAEAAFLLGARASAASIKVQRTDLGLPYMQQLAAQLASPQPQRIIGLVDDASATLILDLARSAGARVQFVGHHAASADGSRHELLSATGSEACALRFGHQLQSCGAGFSLREQGQAKQGLSLDLAVSATNADAADQWLATLGHTLACAGRADAPAAPRISNLQTPLRGHFVSFSIESGRSLNV